MLSVTLCFSVILSLYFGYTRYENFYSETVTQYYNTPRDIIGSSKHGGHYVKCEYAVYYDVKEKTCGTTIILNSLCKDLQPQYEVEKTIYGPLLFDIDICNSELIMLESHLLVIVLVSINAVLAFASVVELKS